MSKVKVLRRKITVTPENTKYRDVRYIWLLRDDEYVDGRTYSDKNLNSPIIWFMLQSVLGLDPKFLHKTEYLTIFNS